MLLPSKLTKSHLPDSTQSLLLSSQVADWRGIHLEYHHKPKGEENSLVLDQLHLLCVETTQRPCDAHKWMDGRFQSRPIIQGDVFVLPKQVQFRERFEGAIDYIESPHYSGRCICVAQASPVSRAI